MDELASAAQELFNQGLAWGSSGNISMKSGAGILISRAGTFFSQMKRDQFVLATPAQIPHDASSQAAFHLALHASVDGRYVVCIHPPNCVAASLLAVDYFMPADEEGKHYFGKIPIADTGDADEPNRASLCVKAMQESRLVLLKGEGLLIWGDDLAEIIRLACAAEFSASVWLSVRD